MSFLNSVYIFFLQFLKETSSYNPLACVEFPCYYTEDFGMGGSGFEHQFQSASSMVQDLKILAQHKIRFESVIIYHYPGAYDPLGRVELLTLNEDEIKATIDPELSDYMESLFPNTLQTFLAGRGKGGSGKRTCGNFAGPCILLPYLLFPYIHNTSSVTMDSFFF
jgi:hypothetical protein